ncbi:hypothetical protein PRIPAC_95871 [Pristionchus pacificus]|uniref:Uncharacterized protein n=1 Tax=Pristionchus pacificus TaxID=54126 RepID=A0A2A6D1V4_PRIPA|nr:hypothetical protein PRIPAC_95871 [Pristionchus pacificus]|eukprot:PDM84424.1 hypothetical protein PRIPAC_33447 [Pristionchus pacificus]
MSTQIAIGSVYIVLNLRAIMSIISKGKLRENFVGANNPISGDIFAFFEGWFAISRIIDALQSYSWSCNSLSQISLAANRFVVTVLLRPTFFTMGRAIFFSIFQHLLAIAITAAVHFILPCCRCCGNMRKTVHDPRFRIAFSRENYGYRDVQLHDISQHAHENCRPFPWPSILKRYPSDSHIRTCVRETLQAGVARAQKAAEARPEVNVSTFYSNSRRVRTIWCKEIGNAQIRFSIRLDRARVHFLVLFLHAAQGALALHNRRLGQGASILALSSHPLSNTLNPNCRCSNDQ